MQHRFGGLPNLPVFCLYARSFRFFLLPSAVSPTDGMKRMAAVQLTTQRTFKMRRIQHFTCAGTQMSQIAQWNKLWFVELKNETQGAPW